MPWSKKSPIEQRLERLMERERVPNIDALARRVLRLEHDKEAIAGGNKPFTAEEAEAFEANVKTRLGETWRAAVSRGKRGAPGISGNIATWKRLADAFDLTLDWLADPTPLPADYELPHSGENGVSANLLPPPGVHDLRVEALKAQLLRAAERMGYSTADISLLLSGRADAEIARVLGIMRDEGLPDFTQAVVIAAMHLFGCSREEATEAFVRAYRKADEEEREHKTWPEEWLDDIRGNLKEMKALRRSRGRRERTKSGEYASSWPPAKSPPREPRDS